ncbi:WYL domain-containing protein [Candidatus Parcubacteria bacterium]|nr:WYL domain-containing protein [Candidatus Parcubacteria bacterium]
MNPNKLVLDLETQNSFADVGGRQNLRLLKVSVAGVFDYETGAFRCYEEAELPELEARLAAKPEIIGFNIRQFDLPVLAPYLKTDFGSLAVLDLMEEVVRFTGHRVSLNSLAAATLGERKIAQGLEAIRFWREGRMEELKTYCLDDVRLTKNLYEYGLKHGELLAETNFGMDTVSVPARWHAGSEQGTEGISGILAQAHSERRTVEIDYVSAGVRVGETCRKKRKVNIYRLTNQYLEGFCHLRGDVRSFRLDRILAAALTGERYETPSSSIIHSGISS